MTVVWSKLSRLLVIGAFLPILAIGCNSSSSVVATPVGSPPAAAPRVGRPAPDFTLPDVEGNPISLHGYQGEVVLINFWGAWCPPCRAEMPHLQTVYEEFKPKGLEIIGVDVPPDTEKDVTEFVERLKLDWVFVMDQDWDVSRAYGVAAFPSTFFLDRQHVVRQVRVGAMSEKELRERLSRLME